MNTFSNILSVVFKILSVIVSVYTLLCFIRIILTWIPNASYSKFASFLSNICDPYLNLFNRIRWLTVGNFNFSPALALCLLGAASTILANFSHQGKYTIGIILAMVLTLVWSIISSLLVFFIILLVIRIILIIANKSSYSGSMLDQIDRSLSPLVYRIAGTFTNKRNMPYKKALIIASIVLLLVEIAGTLITNFLAGLLGNLPF